MQTAEIEQRRSYYRDVLRRWSENLYELDEHPTYRLLAAGELAGTTGAQTTAIMETAPQLWSWLGDLRRQLEAVDALVEEQSMFRNNAADIELLLTGSSISLDAVSMPKTVRAGVGGLVEPAPGDPTKVLTSCDGLIEVFRTVYEPVRDVVARVDAVWRDIMPRIDAATVTLERANGVIDRLGVRVPEVALATQRLEAVRSSVADDPLSLSSNVGPDLDKLVANAAAASGSLERAHGSLDADLSGVDSVLANLRVLRARAAAAYSEAAAKVVPVSDLIRTPGTSVIDGPNGLAHRAAQIVGDAQERTGDWQEARSSLDRWHHAAGRLRAQLQKALDRNTAPIEQRNELRGRLRAYRVKASMTPGIADDVAALGQQAHDELYTSPTNIERAVELIEEFATALATYSGRP